MKEERRRLDDYDLKHCPTIGNMYEGLSSKVLEGTIPPGLDLKVVEGFIVDHKGALSPQIDCMLVSGKGEEIPYSTSFKWPIRNVLAVIEVKKNLYGSDISDSFHHLRTVSDFYVDWIYSDDSRDKIDINPALRAFSQITGIHAPPFSERENLSHEMQVIYHTIVMEQIRPLTIVLGYNGYKSESSLREGFCKFLESKSKGERYGVPLFPHLITCNNTSLVKTVGQPWAIPMTSEHWDFFASSSTNPVLLLLELIWTKISNTFKVRMPWGDDLEVEVLNRLMEATVFSEGKLTGWLYTYTSMTEEQTPKDTSLKWEPLKVTMKQFHYFNLLCNEIEIDVESKSFIEDVTHDGQSVEDFVRSMTQTGFVAINGTQLVLTTVELNCAILPNGDFVVAENNSGRFMNYVHKNKNA